MTFASLSSGLLARKGQARPAMRPQGFDSMVAPPREEDLGWNDMGSDQAPAPSPASTEAPLPARVEAPADAKPAATAEIVHLPMPRAAAGSKGKSAFTLRLDPVRHLRLRLAAALHHRSAQALVTEAVDAFLASPEIDALAEQANRGGSRGDSKGNDAR